MHRRLTILFLIAASGLAGAQQPRELIRPERVGEIISFLASDELAGRDTPSPGLEAAAKYLADNFGKAGLRPAGTDKTWFHTYSLAGQTMDYQGIELRLMVVTPQAAGGREADTEKPEKVVTLTTGTAVRLYRPPAAAYARDRVELTVVDEASARRRLGWNAPRRPVVILVGDDSPLWNLASKPRDVLKSRRVSRVPFLLVRASAWPKGEVIAAKVVVPAAVDKQIALKNVAAMLPGSTKKDEFVVFTAHYDHVGIGLPVDGDGIYNGADDDATGTTAVLALAEAYAKAKIEHQRSFLFLCVSGEEKGLRGSRAFVESPTIPLDKIACNINIEMIGRPEAGKRNAAWITGRERSDFEAIAKVGLARAGIEVIDFPMAQRLFMASDNASFFRKGIVAHSISAGSLHKDYHQPSDSVAKLDLPHMTAVIRGIFEVGLEFANRDAHPAYRPTPPRKRR